MTLMRMNNPDDQEYAARVVSDQFRSLISLLPSMKPGEGFIIGDAVLMPMRTLIDLPPKLPQSGNVDFFGLWSSGGKGCDVDRIIERWWRQERSAGALLPDAPPATPQEPPANTPTRPPAPAAASARQNAMASAKAAMAPPTPQPAEPAAAPSPPDPETKPTAGDPSPDGAGAPQQLSAEQKLAQLAAMLGVGKAGD